MQHPEVSSNQPEASTREADYIKPSERRQFQRLTTVIRGRLFHLDSKVEGVVLDVSINGVKMKLMDDLPLGAPVTLAIAGSVYFGGEVVWKQGEIVGVCFAKQPEEVAHIMAAFLPMDCLKPAGNA